MEPRWLADDELAAWKAAAALVIKLPGALDAQLQAEQGLTFFEYMVLAVLSERADRTLQMSVIVAAAPSHVARVRHLLVDAVPADDLAALRRISETVIERIDPGRSC